MLCDNNLNRKTNEGERNSHREGKSGRIAFKIKEGE